MSSDRFNRSRIATVVVAVVTSNLRLGRAPGNVTLDAGVGGLPEAQWSTCPSSCTVDRSHVLTTQLGGLPRQVMTSIDAGLRLVLGLR